MISHETEELLWRLLAEQPSYKPIATIRKQIADVEVICFVGASCMGKTTLMQQLVAKDSAYGEFVVFTSRQPRPEDNQARYTYYAHDDEGLHPLLERIKRREVLQYNINPFNLHVYGSEVTGYTHRYNIGDIFSSSIDGFRQIGFKKVTVISVITTPAAWRRRFDERFPVGNPHRQARLLEAASSIKWSLTQTRAEHAWVINRDGESATALDDVQNILVGKSVQDDTARQLATDCLSLVEGLRA